ncbi:uncharacterized protein LOC126176908 isoform X1 [Schistocerca cancellata]|uniref:uncharacterized protein LOC126176908 isoform X1 n=1 Tax=Schistocerca cancellata TaxID=274614 RepID=UPI002119911C|nr:uncharacterized protein LOC126176908 isoform X1 [Schistocerca cancellata]XP_049780063.1 uncharacterized protein LOC126176908 isoform X1 [Schistocerca cancellata]
MANFIKGVQFYFLMLLIPRAYFTVLDGYCPYYCQCYMWENMKAANCVNQNIITVDISIPRQTEALDVSNNFIRRIEDHVFKKQGITSLKYLNVSGNHLKYIEMNAFTGLNKLQILDLSKNHLHYLFVKTFDVLDSLRALYMSGNKFSKWTWELHLNSLKVLDLSYCDIESIAVNALSNMENLQILSLKNNQLSVLNENVFHQLHNLELVDISGNPLRCNEETNSLQQWFTMQMIKHTAVCRSDEKQKILHTKDKLQKIVSAVEDTTDDAIEDLRNFWTIEHNEGVVDSNKICECENSTTKKSNYFLNIQVFEEIPSFWAFLIGLQIGIVISITVILLRKIKCCQCRLMQSSITSQHRLSQTSALEPMQEESTCLWDNSGLETPPPPYRDVVFHNVADRATCNNGST